MNKTLKWHKRFTEKKRIFYGLSPYKGYWFSWFKGVVWGIFIMWLIKL